MSQLHKKQTYQVRPSANALGVLIALVRFYQPFETRTINAF